MAGQTSVPAIEFAPSGLVLPSEDSIRAGVLADWNAAMGGNLNPAPSAPQGQLITSQAAIIADKNAKFAAFVAGIDPATSDGPMQDAIGKLYFLDRIPAASTTVDVTCVGRVGVVIPSGALVQDASGNLYTCVAGGAIPAGGSIILMFANTVAGPTPCPAGAINGAPYRTIAGWDRVSNAAAGTTGRDVENRADFEYRRQLSVGRNARGTVQAVYGEVINVAGVTDAYCIDNYSGSPVVRDGITLAPHSVYVAAVGGSDNDVGAAVWRKAGGGCDFNGNTTVNVTDDSDYSIPKPTYDVTFQRPADMPIHFALVAQNLSGQPNSTVATAIKNAIVAAFKGSNAAVPRARIGSTIVATQYVLPVASVATIAILSIIVENSNSIYVGIGRNPTISPDNISVVFQ